MRKIILAASAALILVPATAQAGKLETRYSALYHAAADKLGPDAVGRNIRRHGVRTDHGVRTAHRSDYRATIARLDRWLHPVQAAPSIAPAPAAPQMARTAAQTGGSGGLPACADESHGNYSTGPANTNASTGATGRWQTLRSHYQPGGICAGFDVNSPSGQDNCAHKIMDQQGASAWVGC